MSCVTLCDGAGPNLSFHGSHECFVEVEELKDVVYYEVLDKSQGRHRATVPKVISGENFPLARVGR